MHLRSRMDPKNNEIQTEIFVILNNIAFTPVTTLTPPDTALTFQWDRKGPLARRGIMIQSFLFCPRKFHEPVRGGQRIPRGSLTDGQASPDA